MGYTRLEYIESTGTQYINTNVIPTDNTEIEMKYSVTEIMNVGPHILSATNWFFPFPRAYNGSNVFYCNRCGSSESYNTINLVGKPNTIYTVKAFPSNKVIIDNVEYGNVVAGMNSNTTPLYMFTYGGDVGNSLYTGKVRVYYCKIWESGELVRDFIPVLDENNVPCMYDKVTETYFYNQGTGSFVAGDVIEIPTPVYNFDDKNRGDNAWIDTISSKSITAANGYIKWHDNSLILTTNTNYFNLQTDYGSYGTFELLLKIDESFVPVSNSNWYICSCIFGCELGGTQRDWGLVIDKDGYFAIGYGNSSIASTDVKANDGTWHTATMVVSDADMKLYIDGVLKQSVAITMSGTSISTYGVGWNNSSGDTSVTGRVATLKVWSGYLTEDEVFDSYNQSISWLSLFCSKYTIQASTLVAFADQARRISGETGELSTAQMLEIFEGVDYAEIAALLGGDA